MLTCCVNKSVYTECVHHRRVKVMSSVLVWRAVSVEQSVSVEMWPYASCTTYLCCPRATLLSTVFVIHIDPVTSIPVSCWRQYCSYISTSRALVIRIDGVETVGAHIGDLWKNLETLSGRWEKQQAAIIQLRWPLEKKKRKEKLKGGETRQSIQKPSESVKDAWREMSSIIAFKLGTLQRTLKVRADFKNKMHHANVSFF